MVNNDSHFLRLIPFSPSPNPFPTIRKLPGPRYDLQKIQERILVPDEIRLFTPDCANDVQDLGWTIENVLELLHAATTDNYRDSEWCATGKGFAVDCDAYALNFDSASATQLSRAPEMFLKFGFRPNFLILIVISCHPS